MVKEKLPYTQTPQIEPLSSKGKLQRPDAIGSLSLVEETDKGPVVINEFQGSVLLSDPRLTEVQKRQVFRRSVRTLTDYLNDPNGLTPGQYNYRMNQLLKLDDSQEGAQIAQALVNLDDDFKEASECLSPNFMWQVQCPDMRVCSSGRLANYLGKISYRYAGLGYRRIEIKRSLIEIREDEDQGQLKDRRFDAGQQINSISQRQNSVQDILATLLDVISDRVFDFKDNIFLEQIARDLPVGKNELVWTSIEDTLRDMAYIHGVETAESLLEILSQKGRLRFDIEEAESEDMRDEQIPNLSELDY